MATTMMLTKFGTRPTELPLGAIITAAETDVRRCRAKTAAVEADGERDRLAAGYTLEALGPSYAFAPKHVRKARSGAELLLIAAQDPVVAEKTTIPNRVLLYATPERLVDAAERALGRSAPAQAMAAE